MSTRTTHTSTASDLRGLQEAVRGPVTLPGDAGWDQARQAWNLAADQRPAAVLHASGPADVIAAIGAARRAGLRVAPQGTGHGAGGLRALDGALLLRTTGMDGVTVDPVARRARVDAGALWGAVVEPAAAHGLAALHGSSGTVGVAGYTLGGGVGWLSRLHGLASESVTAIELVTPDGRLRRVAAEHDAELFWALRGGGGSFGVVTSLELDLHPLPQAFGGTLAWPGELAPEILNGWREWSRELPDEVTSTVRFLQLPPLPQVPEPLRGVPVVDVGVVVAGDPAAAAELLAPLRALAPPLIDALRPLRIEELATLHGDPELPVPAIGHHALLRELTPATVDALVEVAGHDSGSPLLGVELRQLGGALGRRAPGHGALGALDASYALYGVGVPAGPAIAAAVRERLQAVVASVAAWAAPTGYLNFSDHGDGDAADVFDAATHAHLKTLQQQLDPDGLILASHGLADGPARDGASA